MYEARMERVRKEVTCGLNKFRSPLACITASILVPFIETGCKRGQKVMDLFFHMQRTRCLWDNHSIVAVSANHKAIGYSGLSSEKGTDLEIQPVNCFCRSGV